MALMRPELIAGPISRSFKPLKVSADIGSGLSLSALAGGSAFCCAGLCPRSGLAGRDSCAALIVLNGMRRKRHRAITPKRVGFKVCSKMEESGKRIFIQEIHRKGE